MTPMFRIFTEKIDWMAHVDGNIFGSHKERERET
jgi:predicted 2-oxoglutarate/Fe(II)-dependent dioxygenase YbiX